MGNFKLIKVVRGKLTCISFLARLYTEWSKIHFYFFIKIGCYTTMCRNFIDKEDLKTYRA